MNEANRQQVLDYLNNKRYVASLSPLYFKGYKDKDILDGIDDVDNMVKEVLKFTRQHSSINSQTNEYETSSDCWRSSLDIWRHIIYYKPEVSIFHVMNSLISIREECGGQYCNDVHRRTFKLKMFDSDYSWSNYQMEDDEYGLAFTDWKDI